MTAQLSNIPMTWRELQASAMRTCKSCGQCKPLSAFDKRYECNRCRLDQRAVQRAANRPANRTVAEAERIGRELHAVYLSWQGGEPHDWTASVGVVCWHPLRAAA